VVEYTYDYEFGLIDVEEEGFSFILRKLFRTIMAEIEFKSK